MARRRAGSGEITVILPPEPPELNPEAARVLLRILLKAHEKQFGGSKADTAEAESRPSSAAAVTRPGAPPP